METINTLKIEKITPEFGAIIRGLNIDSISTDDAETLRKALKENQLLVVKSQTLEPQQQIDFSKIFGPLETFPYGTSQLKEYPEIFRLSTDGSKGYKNVGFYWHQDGSFNEVPTPVSIFHLTEIPKTGGETLFASAYKAYDLLSPKMKEVAENLKTVNRGGSPIRDMIITHPQTGRKSVYLNFGLTSQIFSSNGQSKEEIEEVVSEIERMLNSDELKYVHQWNEGDIIVADNFAVFHQATDSKDDSTRTLHRTTVQGQHRL